MFLLSLTMGPVGLETAIALELEETAQRDRVEATYQAGGQRAIPWLAEKPCRLKLLQHEKSQRGQGTNR